MCDWKSIHARKQPKAVTGMASGGQVNMVVIGTAIHTRRILLYERVFTSCVQYFALASAVNTLFAESVAPLLHTFMITGSNSNMT